MDRGADQTDFGRSGGWRVGMATLAAMAMLTASGCADETVSGYADPDAVYRLVEIDGNAFGALAEISFPEPGRISGRAPCNQFNGALKAPYPWFEPGALAVTRRACPDLAAESAFFEALQAMRLAEISGDVLLLSTEDGRQMVFRAAPSDGG